MKFQVRILAMLGLITTASAGSARIRIEQDGADVKITESGRFDWRSDCEDASSVTNIVNEDDALFAYTTDDFFLDNLLVEAPHSASRVIDCDPIEVECDMLFGEDAPNDFFIAALDTTTDSFKSLGILSDDEIRLFIDRSIAPGERISGTATITGALLSDFELTEGDTCHVRFQDGSLFKTPQQLVVKVGPCGFFCGLGEAIYDLLGDILFFTYIF